MLGSEDVFKKLKIRNSYRQNYSPFTRNHLTRNLNRIEMFVFLNSVKQQFCKTEILEDRTVRQKNNFFVLNSESTIIIKMSKVSCSIKFFVSLVV